MDYEGENAKRMVLRSHVGRDTVDRLARDCHGMIWWDEFEADADQPYEKVWILPPDDATSLHYIDDTYAEKRYLIIKGEEVDKVAACFYSADVIVPVSESIERYEHAGTNAEAADALISACLTASRDDEETIKRVLKDAIRRKDQTLREAAVVGVSYLGWESLIPVLQSVVKAEDDPAAQRVARDLADFMKSQT